MDLYQITYLISLFKEQTHAAGVINFNDSNEPSSCPRHGNGRVGYERFRKLGYVKFDYSGLKTLTIHKVHKKKKQNDLWNFSVGSKNGELDDLYEMIPEFEKTGEGKKTYKYISVGFTDNIFQLDSFIGKQI